MRRGRPATARAGEQCPGHRLPGEEHGTDPVGPLLRGPGGGLAVVVVQLTAQGGDGIFVTWHGIGDRDQPGVSLAAAADVLTTLTGLAGSL
jgi:hypothetical protein